MNGRFGEAAPQHEHVLDRPLGAECGSQGLPRAVRGTRAGGSTRGAQTCRSRKSQMVD